MIPANNNRFIRPAILVAAITAFAAGSASGATFQWDGGAGTGNWQTAANWDPDAANTTFNSTTNNRLNVNGTQALIYTAAEGTTVYANTSNGTTFRGLVIGSGVSNTTSGTMTIIGGTFSTAGSAVADLIGNGDNNTATLTINGGNYISGTLGTALGVSSGNGNLNVQNGKATITTLNYWTTGTSTTSLTGGTLEVDKITTTVTIGTYTINLDGGTLKAGAGASGAFMSGLTNAYVKSNGAKIDSNGKTITISQNLVDFTTPSGGGLTLNDTAAIKGTLTLSGTGNTYTGATVIKAGTLKLNTATTLSTSSTLVAGDTGSSSAVLDVTTAGLTVGSSQTLKGIGTVLATGQTVTVSGKLAAGDTGVGTLTTSGGSLTMNSGSIFEWDLNATAPDPGANTANSGSYDKVIANSTVTGTAKFNVSLLGNAFTNAFWDTNKSWSDIFSTTGGGTFNLASMFTTFGGTSVGTDGTVTSQGKFSFTGNTLNWTAVPEPTGALAGLLLAAGLLRRRRM